MSGPPKPPPPPPPSGAPPVPEGAKGQMALAESALRLRREQLRARVVYVDPDLETNAELDAITAQVVKELQEMQAQMLAQSGPQDRQAAEIELIKNLRELLEKMVSPRRETYMRHKIEQIQRRITNLYFTTVSQGDAARMTAKQSKFDAPDEALFHVLTKHEKTLVATLKVMRFSEDSVREEAIARLKGYQRQLLSDFLSRSMPELERLLNIYRDLLLIFLLKDFREQLGDFCWQVIKESRVALTGTLTYKIEEKEFPAFREIFERKFLEGMLAAIQKPLAEKLEEGEFREATLRFAADPRIYAEICGVTSNMLYDYLHGEGFLDLPVNWQQQLYEGD